MNVVNHVKVAQHFARAHESYTQNAVVQKQICEHLLALISEQNIPKQQDRIFEIGCGTGNLTDLMWQYFNSQKYMLNDLYDEVKSNFLDDSLQSIEWQIGDIEQLEFPQQLNAIVSASALQWVNDLSVVLEKSKQALLPEGYFIFSTFGEKNLHEIKQLTGQGLSYLSSKKLKEKLNQAGFELLLIQEETIEISFDQPRNVLQHLKATGVTATSNQFRWTKQSLADFYKNYEQFKLESQQYLLTYHPIYCIARSI